MLRLTLTSLVVGLLSLLSHIRSTSAGYCTESYSCTQTCNRQQKYHTKCGFLNLSRCTRYRTVQYSCQQTCYRQVCCAGYTGSDCTIPTCYGRTSCLNGNKCIGPDRCQCTTGYHTPRCEDTNECTSNNGGCEHVCTNNVGSFTCSCHPGYTLRTDLATCEDVNECITNNGGCQHVCVNKPGKYECTCNPGYVLTADGSSCTDEDECQTGTHLCDHTCYNTIGSYTCSCRRGFLLDSDGHTCLDVDECAQTPYPCPQMCTNSPGSYYCGCGPGYQEDTLSNTCTDIDECSTGVSGCNQMCSNTPGSFTCDCHAGYTLLADGATCVDIDECTAGLSRCSQACINTLGSYNCSCSHGYQLDSDGVTCKDIDNCAGVTCQNSGYCVDGVGSYTCSCPPGFTGNNCELDIDECGDHLQGGCEAVCVNTPGSYHCECTGNRTIQTDGFSCSGGTAVPSVFRRQSLVRRFLPRGCSTIQISKCQTGHDVSVVLSSTSPWYQLKSDSKVLYTLGIVFVELNSLALPVSITGLQVSNQGGNFSLISGSLAYDTNDGVLYGNNRTSNCWEFNTTPHDVHDFLTSNSFIATFFNALEQDLLPDWLTFSHNGDVIFGVHELQTDITKGSEIQKGECSGAPLFDDHLYTILRFGNTFSLSLYGETVSLPQPARNKKFCFIIDICQDLGGTMFLMLPEDSRDILEKFDLLKGMVNIDGLHLRPKGIGLSIAKHINVHSDTTEVQLWKGDDLFRYPVMPEANFWIGGGADMSTDWLKLSGDANFFLSVPTPASLLKSVFYDEWDMLMNLKVAGLLELKFNADKLGNQKIRGSISGDATALASLGGVTQRQWCGAQANPEGIFLSLAFAADAFLDAPVLKNVHPDVDGEVHAFLAKDTSTIVNQTIAVRIQDLLNVKDFCQKLVNTSITIVSQYSAILTNTSRDMMNLLQTSAQKMVSEVGQLITKVTSLQFKDIPSVLQNINDIWHGSWKQVRNHTAMFVDSLKENTAIAKHNISQLIEQQVDDVKNRFQQLFKRMTNEVMSTVKESDGLGLRFKGGLNMFGLKLIGLEIEIVYSIDRLGQCGRFAKAYKLMQGEKAVRAYAALSSDVIGIKLCKFISLKDVGIGFAISVENRDKFAAQIHAQASVLGATADVDVFITNQGLYFYSEIDVWAIFKAQIDVSAEVGKEWQELTFDVQGRFVADVDGDGSFDDSYSAALRRFTKHLSDEAERRLSGVQDSLTKAQDGLTKAHNWIEDKKAIFRDANSKFDDAVHTLDNAKTKLEEAKRPFQNAMDKLNEAQRKVDNLCRIKDCRKICVPGIKCSICHKKVWGARIPYPCCKFTSCMISFPDPICVAANLICRGVRAIAYTVLEAAKIFVRVPMLALDAAKAFVSATQFVVDKSRVVLDIAIAALDIANLGLEHAKWLLEGAKAAIEAVKQVIKLGVAALNFVLKYGLENIIDVRNCGFEVQLSTYDKSVFDVHCEVNIFKLGFKTIRLRVNFTDIVQSLWYAAKSAIESVLNSVGDLFSGRKRREIESEAVNILYRTLREANDGHANISTTDVYETINIVAQTMGYENDSGKNDYSNRVEIFRRKCNIYTSAHGFLLKAVQLLYEMSNETMSDVDSASEYEDMYDIKSIHSQISSFSLVDIGIDEFVARTDFNITNDELAKTVQDAKANVSNDAFFSDAAGYSSLASSMLKEQIDDAQNINIIPHWINAMDNMTGNYFNDSECVSFLDCAHFSVAKLYEIFILSREDNHTQISDTLSEFENVFLNMTKNFSQSAVDVRNMTVELIDKLEVIDNDNVFCAKQPVAVNLLQNRTVIEGQALNLDCDATGDFELKYTWFKDDVVVGHDKRLEINAISRDGSGMYHCVASNVVANLTMEPAYIEVKFTTKTTATEIEPTEAETTSTTPVPVHINGNVGLCPTVIYLQTLQDGGSLTQFGQSCYEFVPARATWATAEKDCQSKNGSLVQLTNARSQNTLYTWIQSFYQQPTWIGMYSFEGQFKWINGNTITFTNWRSVGSIGYDDKCVVMVSTPTYRGQWELVQCDRQYAYICEFNI